MDAGRRHKVPGSEKKDILLLVAVVVVGVSSFSCTVCQTPITDKEYWVTPTLGVGCITGEKMSLGKLALSYCPLF